ncbi:MAG TPA: hypothetical protein VL283_03150 [Candidatus Baltobacteraceae bacterium]|nr:hypothetical protein [Candidatus Baltobacteraceae bacterium]
MATPPLQPEQKPAMPVVDSTLKQEDLQTQRIKPLYRGSQIVWYIVGLMEVFLLIRFFLKLLGANPAAGFTSFIYGVTGVFAMPFYSVFKSAQVEGAVFEGSTVLAMIVYALFGWLIVKALVMSKPVTTAEANKKLPEQEKM